MNEAAIQTQIVSHFRAHYEGIILHPANGGRRGLLEAIRFKAMGVQPGTPDLILLTPRGAYFIEVKTSKGALSRPQKAFIDQAMDMGFGCAIVRSVEDASRAFIAWGLPRKEATVRVRAETGF